MTLVAVVASCVAPIAPVEGPVTPTADSGPAADYPVVIGEPYTIDGVTYTPSDRLNYDEVGYATVLAEQADGIVGSHKTLPLPSYVEVTALDSGRTALVRIEQRGPMTGARLIGLSAGALAQIGLAEGAPVRVRRTNPPESERALLRTDEEAPLRMDTPQGLLDVLKRALPTAGSVSLAPEGSEAQGADDAAIAVIDPDTDDLLEPPGDTPDEGEATTVEQAAEDAAPPKPASPAITDGWVVQAGAYSIEPSARRVAADIGGYVEKVGRLWRVRSGPYANREEARAALAKVRGAGYRGAQIYRIR